MAIKIVLTPKLPAALVDIARSLLPAEFELATVYAIAVAADSPHPDLAQSFAALLAGPAAKLLREHGGFEA